jgi:hypothetical protein
VRFGPRPGTSTNRPGSSSITHTPDDITTAFADGWRIDSLQPTTLDSPTGSTGFRAWQVAVTRI